MAGLESRLAKLEAIHAPSRGSVIYCLDSRDLKDGTYRAGANCGGETFRQRADESSDAFEARLKSAVSEQAYTRTRQTVLFCNELDTRL